MGYDQGAGGVPSHRPLSVLVEPITSRRPVVVCARSPPIRCRVRRPTHAAVRRHIVRVSLRILTHLSRPLAPPTRDGRRYLLLPRVMGAAISRGVGVNSAPFSCVGVPRRRGWTALSRPGRWRVFQPRSPVSTGSWFDSPCQDMILSRMMQCIKSCIEMVERRKGGTRRLDASELGTDRSRYPEST